MSFFAHIKTIPYILEVGSMSIDIEKRASFGYGFVKNEFLMQGHNEYYYRFLQNPKNTYRALTSSEIEALQKNGNRCDNWADVLVEEPFLPHLVRGCEFAGLVRLGAMQDVVLKYHDFAVRAGIYDSTVISCDIGSTVAIHSCTYLSHYIIEDCVILSRIDELSATDHAKFGEGIVKDGESEEVRVKIEVVNESGGRDIFPFRSILTQDAYIWSKYRGDVLLIKRLEELTQGECDSRRGYYGVVSKHSVIKSSRIIKDVFVGEGTYIKGANKLKNLSILSSLKEPSQIGEGVEMVNGIIGFGSHIFYGVKAVRFVVGRHCTLKYGARLIHSVLGDNSTISCCEVLNTLIFPFHEQHHNNSFLIAAMVMGQSNMAAGATVGSNHNTRGNDGEIIAGRGFWPGLSITLKHNCKFASFVLISKGSYRYELNIPFPFALIVDNEAENVLEIMPAYYWMYNMYALERNAGKFEKRDKRVDKSIPIETGYLAPDTALEMLKAIDLLQDIIKNTPPESIVIKDEKIDTIYAKPDFIEKSKRNVKIVKIERAIESYKEMLIFYCVKTLCLYFEKCNINFDLFLESVKPENLSSCDFLEWENVAGFFVRRSSLKDLLEKIKEGDVKSWQEVHQAYLEMASKYQDEKLLNAYFVLSKLQGRLPLSEDWNFFVERAVQICALIEREVFKTKQKDYTSFFREMTYSNVEEMDAVLKKLEDNVVIKESSEKSKRYVSLFKKYKV